MKRTFEVVQYLDTTRLEISIPFRWNMNELRHARAFGPRAKPSYSRIMLGAIQVRAHVSPSSTFCAALIELYMEFYKVSISTVMARLSLRPPL